MQRLTPNELRGTRAVVLGLGRFGGGAGAVRFLAGRGAGVTVVDRGDAEALRASLDGLEDVRGVTYRLGPAAEAEAAGMDFASEVDYVVANPAVRPDHPVLAAAGAAGVAVTTEVGLLIERLPAGVVTIGVTGTAGKSTTAAMIGHALTKRSDRPVRVGGNLGGSLLAELDATGADDWLVLELSSFMLHYLRPMRWSPRVAVLTNFAANHLDWHDTLEAYRRDKQTIFDFQSDERGDAAIGGPGMGEPFDFKVARFAVLPREPSDAAPPFELVLPGEHNRVNARLAALAVEAATGLDEAETLAALADFAGLPHRLQLVVEHSGVRFFNDSKSTTPESAMRAIDAFEPGTVHAILGGYDKGVDLGPLARLAASRCRAVYCIGETGGAIAAAASSREGPDAEAEVLVCGELEAAVEAVVARARPGEAAVLTPGCASWDRFDHFERRGEAFTEAVIRWTTETGA